MREIASMKPYTYICALAAFFVLFVATPCARAEDPLFTVSNIRVDVTAENSAKARDQAMVEARSQAFDKLVDRLLSDDEKSRFQKPDDMVISTMIRDFEIKEERLSGVRYMATLTFRFEDEKVRNFMSGSGVKYTDVAKKPIMIIPIYQRGRQTLLWEDDNIWFDAWKAAKNMDRGIVPILIPIGDIEDMRSVSGDTALSANTDAMAAMAARYGASDVILALGMPEGYGNEGVEGDFRVFLYNISGETPQHAKTIIVNNDNMASADLLAEAVQTVRTYIQKDWKSQTTIDPTLMNNMRAVVHYRNIGEWVRIQSKLDDIAGSLDYNVLNVGMDKAVIDMSFQGTEARLRLALKQRDLVLSKPRLDFTDSMQRLGGDTPLIYDLSL